MKIKEFGSRRRARPWCSPYDPPMVIKSSNSFNNTQSLLAYLSDQMPLDEQEEGPNQGRASTSL